MVVGMTLFIVAILIISIWVIVEIKRLNHKIFAIFLIGLILFVYISVNFTLGKEDINLRSFSGIMQASKIYLSWLGSIFGNLVKVSSHAIKLNWGVNNTIG